MPNRGNRRVTADELGVDTWKYPDEGALSDDDAASYRSRRRGLKLYLDGAADETIKAECGLSLSQIYKLMKERCLAVHPDGEVWGWRGLLPNVRVQPYRRKKKISVDKFGMGAVGALNSLLDEYPDLRAKFEKRILSVPKSNGLGRVTRSKMNHFQWFLNQLRALGLEQQNLWPFNTEQLGYVSVTTYISTLWEKNPSKGALVVGGIDTQKKLLSGDGNDRPVQELLQRVEMDAHKLDGRFCISIPQPTGGYINKIVHRLWVVVLLEVVSRAVIGYHLSMRKEVSKIDVLRAIKMAVTQWQKPKISFGDHGFLPHANLPSGLSNEYVGLCWNETSVDGALAETCKTVKDVLKTVVGSELLSPENSFAVRRSKDDRPFIEAFFKNLASRGFQQLTNTTGANPKAKPSKDPDAVALTSQFQHEYAKELLETLIANYNATPHSSLGGRSPLEYFKFRFSQLQNVRYADAHSITSMISYRKLCNVLGGYKAGRSPYINFHHGRYSSETLAQRHDLIGKKIWIVSHLEDDVRVVLGSTLDGQPLGLLTVRSPWSRLPHSLEVRTAIQSIIRNDKLRIASGQDAVEAFIAYCEQQKGKKLPVHPAYMEARRILIDVAASLTESAPTHSEDSHQAEDDSPADNCANARNAGKSVRKSSLPPHRKAAN